MIHFQQAWEQKSFKIALDCLTKILGLGIGLTPLAMILSQDYLLVFLTATSLEFPTAGCASGTNECGQLCGNP